MSLKVRSEERVAVLQVFLQTCPNDKSFASDDVIFPHFDNFDKSEFVDEWHLQKCKVHLFELCKPIMFPNSDHFVIFLV